MAPNAADLGGLGCSVVANRPVWFASWIMKVNPGVMYWFCKAHSFTKVKTIVWNLLDNVCIYWSMCGDGTCTGNWACDHPRSWVYWQVNAVLVRFQPGSLKPTRTWPRWVSSKQRCASSRPGSLCPSLESLIFLPSKWGEKHMSVISILAHLHHR